MIVVGGPGYLLVKDGQTGNTILDLPIGDTEVYNLAWSPNGEKLLSVSGDQTIRIWKVTIPSHQPLETPASINTDQRFGFLRYGGWSPDGQYITSSYFLDVGFELWDAITYKLVKCLAISEASVFAWNPDTAKNQIAFSGEESGPSLVTLSDPPIFVRPVGGRDIPARVIKWSPDGNKLAVAYSDGPTIIWNVKTNTKISVISSGDDGSERSISWSPDNQTIAVASGNGTVSVWNADTGELMYSTKPFTGVVAALSPDGKRIAFAWEYGETQIADITELAAITPALTITLTPPSINEFPDVTDEPR